mgnify:FL=1
MPQPIKFTLSKKPKLEFNLKFKPIDDKLIIAKDKVGLIEVLVAPKGNKGDKGDAGVSIADPGDLTILFENGLI